MSTSTVPQLSLSPITADSSKLSEYLGRVFQALSGPLYVAFTPVSDEYSSEVFRLIRSQHEYGWSWCNQAPPSKRIIGKQDFEPFWSKEEEARLRKGGHVSLPGREWKYAETAVLAAMESDKYGWIRVLSSAYIHPDSYVHLPTYVLDDEPRIFSPKTPNSRMEVPACQPLADFSTDHLVPGPNEKIRVWCTGVYTPAEEPKELDLGLACDLIFLPRKETEL